jgi:RNA polymerase sigma-70 factor (ECF subfamily)
VDDTVKSWERWALAISAGHAGAPSELLSVGDLGSRRRPGERPASGLGDEELAVRFRRGDEQAFNLLYARYRAPLLRFVRRTTADPSDLEELVQEIWLAVIRGRERYMPRARFVTYLFSIARRRSIDRWRRHGVQLGPEENINELEALPSPVQTWPEPRAQTEAIGAAILCAVDALPPTQREIFLLRAETDLTLDEIAQVTCTTRETAKSRLRYALARLRASLEPWNER